MIPALDALLVAGSFSVIGATITERHLRGAVIGGFVGLAFWAAALWFA